MRRTHLILGVSAGFALFLVACGESQTGTGSMAARTSKPLPIAPPPAGSITGRIVLEPKDPNQPPESLSQVFVYVKEELEGKTYPLPAEPVILDQIAFQFVPHVFEIRVGQTLRITSQDSSQHNVFCQPFNNKGFNESLFAGEVSEKKFTAPEVMILLQCNIHHIMKAYAGVLDHPFFAVSGEGGTFEIKGISPGRYKVAVWQELMGSREIDVDLGQDRGRRVEITYK